MHTWHDPAYDSHGLLVAAAVAVLAIWSASSELIAARLWRAHMAFRLLALSALVRLVGQVGAINVLGALTLVLDFYAIGLLLQLDRRRRALSPAWLAAAFAFALPIERILQRSLGYALQQVAADGACGVLQRLFGAVTCQGVRIVLDGRDVLVDLPCSGARTLMLTALAFTLVCCVLRPRPSQAATGFAMTLFAALIANVLRIVALAVGIGCPAAVGGIDVMAAPWHDAIGFVALALAVLPLAVWARAAERNRQLPSPIAHLDFIPDRIRTDCWWLAPSQRAMHPALVQALSLAAFCLALLIVNLPRKPIDVARRDTTLSAPASILGQSAQPVPLDAREAAYFTQHGGAAVKATYGPHDLLIVRTSSPLRHLHAPDECLRGLGFKVAYGSMVLEPVPTAFYLATAPSGERYRIDVSFISDRGHVTASVAAAVWHWLRGEAGQWTAIQRITPDTLPATRHAEWSAAALAVLGVDPIASHRSSTTAKGDLP